MVYGDTPAEGGMLPSVTIVTVNESTDARFTTSVVTVITAGSANALALTLIKRSSVSSRESIGLGAQVQCRRPAD